MNDDFDRAFKPGFCDKNWANDALGFAQDGFAQDVTVPMSSSPVTKSERDSDIL